MAVMLTSQKLVNLANTVRLKVTENNPYLLAQIPDKIRLLKSDGSKTPGTYGRDTKQIKSWPELKEDGDVIVDNNKVMTTPDDRADRFSDPDVISVVIDPEVKEIGDDAFRGVTTIEEVVIPDSVEDISPTAFEDDNMLDDIQYDGDATGRPWGAPLLKASGTYNANGQLVRTWDQLLSAGAITVENGVLNTEHGTNKFGNPYSSFSDNGPYYNSEEMTLVIDDSVLEIGERAFLHADFNNIVLPKNIVKIGGQAFWNWSLDTPSGNAPSYTFVIPESVNVLSDNALGNLTKLTKIVMLSHITPDSGLGAGCFSGCDNLKDFTFPNGWTRTGVGTLARCGGEYWEPTDPNNKYYGLKKVRFPDSLIRINESCFNWCVNLSDVILPPNLLYIDDYAFYSCKSLTEITIPNSVVDIGSSAFGSCEKLTTIHYSGSATGAPWGATNATVVP